MENTEETQIANLLAQSGIVIPEDKPAPAPTAAPAKRGVPVGTRHFFPFAIADLLALKEQLNQEREAGDEKAGSRLETLETILTIPQQVTTEIPRTPEQVLALIDAETADAKEEGRMPDLEMIAGLATIKKDGYYTAYSANSEGVEEMIFRNTAIREYYQRMAEKAISALGGIAAKIAAMQAAKEKAEENAE